MLWYCAQLLVLIMTPGLVLSTGIAPCLLLRHHLMQPVVYPFIPIFLCPYAIPPGPYPMPASQARLGPSSAAWQTKPILQQLEHAWTSAISALLRATAPGSACTLHIDNCQQK